ncbi:T7SS effector LXG polymorphic toxin [Bacillus sp. NSP9.1]|uniref:T7SS effector LXG polymorphic toxin n=1 Tax=Bacillus sp. NSP9.1 TaxID=1071078 RepID=UPI0003F8CA93|nr:T7SS effector LXG polymorphic toxin [Bacillus sp. NSP9.1]QHZ48348.1 integrase [Bacillus sp. NSP9.1]
MKTLDVQSLRDGIDDTLEQLKKQSDEIAEVKKSVDGITYLDDALKGKGGDAIRAFYEECHTPFLRFYETFIEEYQSALKNIKNALDSFEANHNGYISQAFLENELEQGLNAADRTTKHLVSKANATISKVSHIADLPQLDDSDFHEQNQKAKKEINSTLEKLHAFDREQTNALKTAEQDLETMQKYITRLEKMYTGPKIEITGYEKGSILKPDEMDALQPNEETPMEMMLGKLDKTRMETEIRKAEKQADAIEKLKNVATAETELDDPAKYFQDIYLKSETPFGPDLKPGEDDKEFHQTAIDIYSGSGGAIYDLAKDFYEGGKQIGWNLGWTIDHLHKDPKVVLDTVLGYDYKGALLSMVDTLAEKWDEKVVHGDAYSRAHYFTYLIGSLAGLRGKSSASTGSKDVAKAGKTAVGKVKEAGKSVKQSVKLPANNRYTPALEGILQDARNSINVKNTPLLKELLEDKKKSVLVQAAPYTFKDSSGVTKTISLKMGHLKNKKHPITGVPYDKNGFPIFKHVGEVEIDKKFYKSSDAVQFRQATLLLKEKLEKNPELKKAFTDRQLQQISKGKKPEGYTWHHHQKDGIMQLVDSDIHGKTGHTGGRNIWGGGSQNR